MKGKSMFTAAAGASSRGVDGRGRGGGGGKGPASFDLLTLYWR
jgi:hypothetical protein